MDIKLRILIFTLTMILVPTINFIFIIFIMASDIFKFEKKEIKRRNKKKKERCDWIK